MSGLTADHELTAEDIKSLRTAGTLCFDWNRRAGTAGIRAIKECSGQDDYTYKVPTGSRLTDYATDRWGGTDTSDLNTGYVYKGSVRFCERTQTWLGLLKPGDKLTLLWVANGNSQITKDAGLHEDSLDLLVERKGKRLVFRVDDRCGLDDLARMLRR